MSPASKPVQSPGLIEGAIFKLFTRSAKITAVESLTDTFRLITLAGEALQGVQWIPGQKVQMQFGGWTQRTYTPISWDAEKGSTQILAYLHGNSPGANWARSVELGDACALFGPRDSLNLNALERPALLFGDETSFGLAHALRYTPGKAQGVELVLEVASQDAARTVLERVGITNAHLVMRTAGDAHMTEVEESIAAILGKQPLEQCVLSGKSTSIQRLNRTLRQRGFSSRQIKTRAYWAPGKKGLD